MKSFASKRDSLLQNDTLPRSNSRACTSLFSTESSCAVLLQPKRRGLTVGEQYSGNTDAMVVEGPNESECTVNKCHFELYLNGSSMSLAMKLRVQFSVSGCKLQVRCWDVFGCARAPFFNVSLAFDSTV